MYQWHEQKQEKTEKQLGGSEKKVTTYTYSRQWSKKHIDSSQFKERKGHENPAAFPVQSRPQQAGNVTVGAFRLTEALIAQVDNFEIITPEASSLDTAKGAGLPLPVQLQGNQFYLGNNPSTPQIGDARVIFEVARPTTVSLIAKQVGDSFDSWTTPRGRTVEQILEIGSFNADELLDIKESENRLLTWILRAVGWAMMFVGILLVLKPISVVADVLPILGDIVGFGAMIVAFLLATMLSFLTIAIAWVAYRPLVGIPLLVLAAGVGAVFWFRRSERALGETAPTPEAG